MTVNLIFAYKLLGVGAYKINLYYFYCDTLQNPKVLCHIWN